MQKFAVNYYKDGEELPRYSHVIECESIESALQISKLAACKGEYCVLLTSDCNAFEMYSDFRNAVLDVANELHKDAQTSLRDVEIIPGDADHARECGMISGLSRACGELFGLLRQYR